MDLGCHPWDVMRIGQRRVSGYSMARPWITTVLGLMCQWRADPFTPAAHEAQGGVGESFGETSRYELEEIECYSQFLKPLSGSTSSSALFMSFFGLLEGMFPDGILQVVWEWIRFIAYQIISISPSFVANCLEMFAFQRQAFIYLFLQQTYIQCWPYAKQEGADTHKYIQKSSGSYINLCMNSINQISSPKWQASWVWQRTCIQQTLFLQ